MQPVSEHTHKWQEYYNTIDGVDCFGGVLCDCGERLTVEEMVDGLNKAVEAKETPKQSHA